MCPKKFTKICIDCLLIFHWFQLGPTRAYMCPKKIPYICLDCPKIFPGVHLEPKSVPYRLSLINDTVCIKSPLTATSNFCFGRNCNHCLELRLVRRQILFWSRRLRREEWRIRWVELSSKGYLSNKSPALSLPSFLHSFRLFRLSDSDRPSIRVPTSESALLDLDLTKARKTRRKLCRDFLGTSL